MIYIKLTIAILSAAWVAPIVAQSFAQMQDIALVLQNIGVN